MHQKRRPGSSNNANGSNNNHRNHRNNNGRNKYRSGSGGGGGGYDSQNAARQKKHAQTQKEKYQNMARDAQVNGERVDAEYFFQHVEHYTRMIAEIEANEPKQERREERQHEERTGDREFERQDAGGEQSEQGDDAPAAMERAHEREAAHEPDADEGEEEAAPTQAAARAPRGRRRTTPRLSAANDADEIPLPASVIPQAILADGTAG